MDYTHCDHSEDYLNLHDCIAERAFCEDGRLSFEFGDGFWILPDHPESNLPNPVRTDRSKVEYTLENGEDCDVTVYAFDKSFFKKVIRKTFSRAAWSCKSYYFHFILPFSIGALQQKHMLLPLQTERTRRR